MGQASRTTKLLLDLSDRASGGANTGKRASLEETAKMLDAAGAFYIAFFQAHPDKLTERVRYFSEQHQAERERLISPHELLTWAETLTVATREHPRPLPSYNFSSQFPDFPFIYRRSVSAPRHAIMYLPKIGKEFGGIFLGHPSYLDLKSEGDRSMMETRETSRDVADG